MKSSFLIFAMVTSTAFYSCNKNDTSPPNEKVIHLSIDKLVFSHEDELVFSLQNLLDQPVYYIRCGGYPKPIPAIEKNDNGIWITHWNAFCDTFLTFCCYEFENNQSITDTIFLQPGIGAGLFRLRFDFSKQFPDYQNASFEVFSDPFTIE